jgi:hypothetical protein
VLFILVDPSPTSTLSYPSDCNISAALSAIFLPVSKRSWSKPSVALPVGLLS